MPMKIIVTGHLRSGTMFLVKSLAINMGIEFKLIGGVNPAPDYLLLGHSKRFRERVLGNTILKSHLMLEDIEALGDTFDGYVKIYIKRNVVDVMRSYYNVAKIGGSMFIGGKDRMEGVSFGEFIRQPNDHVFPYRGHKAYDRNRISFWKHHIENGLYATQVYYDDLLYDFEKTLTALAEELSLPLKSYKRPKYCGVAPRTGKKKTIITDEDMRFIEYEAAREDFLCS